MQEKLGYHEDDVYSFFLYCHHLQDWVEELNQVGITQEDIKMFVKSHTVLRICADLANATKHCKLKHQKVTGYKHQPSISGSLHQDNTFGNGVKSKFSLISGYAYYDALEVAEECFGFGTTLLNRTSKFAHNKAFKRDSQRLAFWVLLQFKCLWHNALGWVVTLFTP
ncbi:hypothetical protein BBM62_06400 [Vibrio parahaemolyticus]|uniref:hypothetical protein n=1 Tax=Vibrio parahaemolyticus TaxID=670 RepID=UPI00084B0A3C|nr:hypothetical protein [Vibrio parahaemolyticus]OEA47682.1 hypothetical protein BBM62_06400 [Vibrio parahaemolyticus]